MSVMLSLLDLIRGRTEDIDLFEDVLTPSQTWSVRQYHTEESISRLEARIERGFPGALEWFAAMIKARASATVDELRTCFTLLDSDELEDHPTGLDFEFGRFCNRREGGRNDAKFLMSQLGSLACHYGWKWDSCSEGHGHLSVTLTKERT